MTSRRGADSAIGGQRDLAATAGDATDRITRDGVWQGVRASVPLSVATAVLGAGFGVAARQASLSLGATVTMTAAVFAGAAQFAALTLWQAPLPLVPIWLSTLAVNARFMLLSASLESWIGRRHGLKAIAAMFVMGEGTWAVSMQARAAGSRDFGVYIGSGVLVALVWIASTAFGFLAAPLLGDPRRFGLDLVLVLFFASALTSTWRGSRDLAPWAAAALATRIPASIVAPEWQVLVAALIGAAVGAWRDARR